MLRIGQGTARARNKVPWPCAVQCGFKVVKIFMTAISRNVFYAARLGAGGRSICLVSPSSPLLKNSTRCPGAVRDLIQSWTPSIHNQADRHGVRRFSSGRPAEHYRRASTFDPMSKVRQ